MRKRVQTGFACPIFVMKMEWASMGNIPKLERAKSPYYGFARIVPDTFPRQGAISI
jgi:iron only hydrogenase large subunit-like protein